VGPSGLDRIRDVEGVCAGCELKVCRRVVQGPAGVTPGSRGPWLPWTRSSLLIEPPTNPEKLVGSRAPCRRCGVLGRGDEFRSQVAVVALFSRSCRFLEAHLGVRGPASSQACADIWEIRLSARRGMPAPMGSAPLGLTRVDYAGSPAGGRPSPGIRQISVLDQATRLVMPLHLVRP
jgi:hypothetical protein